VICPDTIGRGLSSWARDPDADYCLDAYAQQALALLDALKVEQAAWLGTSMGGIIGMRIASGPHAARLKALIVNDIGPELPQSAIDRILAYTGAPPVFASVAEAEALLRQVYLPFGPAEDDFWQRMAETSVRRRDDGSLTLHYDPRIVRQFEVHPEDFFTWDRYETISTPMHLFRGAKSDLLTDEIATRMKCCGPKPGITLFEDCGHAPSLSNPKAIATVKLILFQMAG
jgi:pimeloyl-ACP methyl ester carboxylesterase